MYLFSKKNFLLFQIVTGKYLKMKKHEGQLCILITKSDRAIRSMTTRGKPLNAELLSNAYSSSAPVASPECRRLRYAFLFINSLMPMCRSEMFC